MPKGQQAFAKYKLPTNYPFRQSQVEKHKACKKAEVLLINSNTVDFISTRKARNDDRQAFDQM